MRTGPWTTYGDVNADSVLTLSLVLASIYVAGDGPPKCYARLGLRQKELTERPEKRRCTRFKRTMILDVKLGFLNET